jgi:hypothetical protein
VLVHPRPGHRPLGDHRHLVERQRPRPQALDAAGQLLRPASDGSHGRGVRRRRAGLPGHAALERPGAGDAPQVVLVEGGDDVDDLGVDGVALTLQLGQPLEQRVEPGELSSSFRRQRGHGVIVARPL